MSEPKKNLSFSGYSTYMTCPKKYDYHYNEKLRTSLEPFHLIFGSATDVALNEVLLKLKKKLPDQLSEKEYANLKKKALGVALKELYRTLKRDVVIEEKDFDREILTHLTDKILRSKLSKVGWNGTSPAALGENLFSELSIGAVLTKNQNKALKYLVIHSALEKIALIIDAFNDYVIPKIEDLEGVQVNVKRGIFDFRAKVKNVEGLVTFDNKTAGRDYESDAVLTSVQIAGYGADYGGYVVFNKTVKKNRTKECSKCKKNGTGQRHKTCDAIIDDIRCNGEWLETITPEVIPQILIDKVPEHNVQLVEQAYCETEKLIEAKVFPRNLNNCGKQFGRPCEYINLCWKNDSTGLKVKKDKSK